MVNEIDDEVLPGNFEFINQMVHREGVEAAENSFRSGCACGGDGNGCKFTTCQCLADLDEEEASDDDQEIHDRSREAYAYYSKGPEAGLLRSEMLESARPLYECHPGCSCSQFCPNRVVERGRTVPLQIFRTKDRGWGEFSSPLPPPKKALVSILVQDTDSYRCAFYPNYQERPVC